MLQAQWINTVAFAALVKRGQGAARVHHHIGARRILEAAVSAPACALGHGRVFHQTRPQGPARFQFGLQPLGLDEAVAVADLAVFESGHVQHAIAIKGVVLALGLQDRVFGVAQIDAIDVQRNRAFQDLQVGGVDFFKQGCPGPLKIGVVTRFQVAGERVHNVDGHLVSNLITVSNELRLSQFSKESNGV